MEPAKPESAATTVEQAAEAVADKHDNEQQYEGYSCGIDVTAKKFKSESRRRLLLRLRDIHLLCEELVS